jgi:Zn-finger nucleic acid-binding protein
MLCPVCKNRSLSIQEVDPCLSSSHCPDCGGRWIASYQYWKWRDVSGKSLPEKQPAKGSDTPVTDSTGAKLCPECGHFLRRFPVGHGIAFGLDRCGNCGGTWFDANEWESLKTRNLHDDVHKIFSEIWQRQIRDEEHHTAMEVFYRKKFGDDGYRKAQEIKTWIESHPHPAELRAFLGI